MKHGDRGEGHDVGYDMMQGLTKHRLVSEVSLSLRSECEKSSLVNWYNLRGGIAARRQIRM